MLTDMEGGDAEEGSAGAVWLLSRAGAWAGRQLSEGAGARGLTASSCGALLVLYDRRITTQQFLRELLGVDRNGMVGLVDDLEERGWVRRRRSEKDRRVHILSLTDRGAEFVTEELLDLIHELDDIISAPLTRPDRERLRETLAQAIERRLYAHRRYPMIKVSGPDFIGLQVRDVPAAADFYENVVGLTRASMEVPGAAIFATEPIPFAVREAAVDLDAVERLGWGAALWFLCEDAQALHDQLVESGVTIATEPWDGPFGRTFAFVDTDGYTITMHDKG